jgi:hypothetical protein
MLGQLLIPATLPSGKKPQMHIEQRAGWAPVAYLDGLEKRNMPYPVENEIQDCQPCVLAHIYEL